MSATPLDRLDCGFDDTHFFVASAVSPDRRWVAACREAEASAGGEAGSLVDVYLMDIPAGAAVVEREAFSLPPGCPIHDVSLVVSASGHSVSLVVLSDTLRELHRIEATLPLAPLERARTTASEH